MRKTKIVCTIGPSSNNEDVFRAMCKTGLNVARLNFSHGTHDEHKKTIEMIKKVREELNLPIAIMLDTKGPEYRIKTFENGKVFIPDGADFTFTARDVQGNENIVSVSYKGLPSDLSVGDKILVNNGLVSFEVVAIDGTEIKCRTLIGGELSNRKSMSFPGKTLRQVYLGEQDKADLLFGIKNGVSFIAASFVSCKQDLVDLKTFLKENGGENIDIIAKIENRSGIENIEDICSECEGIMIGRGDLGVEIPFAEVPAVQKYLITKCRLLGKRVITATEMLESMIQNPRPTRAEISDVANAVYDGTSAVMLSGETAAGEYPVEAVKAMAKIVEQAEKYDEYLQIIPDDQFVISSPVQALSHSACTLAKDLHAKAIVVCTHTGMTARMVSRFRPRAPIIGLTTSEKAFRKLALSWGVEPMTIDNFNSVDVLFYFAKEAARKSGLVKKGERVVLTGGTPTGKGGNTSLISIDVL